MDRSKFYLVSEDYMLIQRVKAFCETEGLELEVNSQEDWNTKTATDEAPTSSSLNEGHSPVYEASNVIPFPGNNKAVQTMNEMESDAIEKAIFEFNGNLTEAAKALGIGRATLYRKVKQYSIDPSLARRKKAA